MDVKSDLTYRLNYIIIPLMTFIMFISSKDGMINDLLKILVYLFICVPEIKLMYKNNKKMEKNFLFFYLLLIVTCVISIFKFHNAIKFINLLLQILSLKFIIDTDTEKIKINNLFCIIIIVLCLYQFIVSRTLSGRAYLPSILDPNYSGYYVFLWVIIFSCSNKKIYSIILSIIGFLTFSRNYMICLFLFFLLKNRQKLRKKIVDFFKIFKLGVGKISFLLIIFILLFSNFFISKYDINKVNSNINETSYSQRFSNIVDGSNYTRFKANIVFVENISKNKTNFMFGYDEIYYKKNVFIFPHNSYLLGFLKYGISFIIFMILFSMIITKKILYDKIEFFVPFFVYVTFLGLGFIGIDIVLLGIILKMNKKVEVK